MHVAYYGKTRHLLHDKGALKALAAANYRAYGETTSSPEVLEGDQALRVVIESQGQTTSECSGGTTSLRGFRLGRLSDYEEEHYWLCCGTIWLTISCVQQNTGDYRDQQCRSRTICDWFGNVGRTRHLEFSSRKPTTTEVDYNSPYRFDECQGYVN